MEKNIFGNILYDLMEDEKGRKGRKTTQDELGKKLGITRQAISNYINGESYPNCYKLLQIADYFNVSTDFLLGRTEDPTTNENMKVACKVTGLSEETIDIIKNLNTSNDNYYYDTNGFKPPLLKILNTLYEKEVISEITKAVGRCLYEVIVRKNYYENCHTIEQEQVVMLPALGYLNKEIEVEIKKLIKPLMREFEDYYTSEGNGYDEKGNNICEIQPR